MVDRWYCYPLIARQLRAPRGCRVGWAPLPEGYREVAVRFDEGVLNIDAKSFDWTFPPWAAQSLLGWVMEQNPGYTQSQKNAICLRFKEVLGPLCTVRLPDGRRYRQTRWGVMKSGWLWTIILNSLHQLGAYSLALKALDMPWLDWPLWAMGDDVLMKWRQGDDVEALRRQLTSLGQLIKRVGPERDFAGYRFQGGTATPVYPDKHLFVLGHVPALELQTVIDAYRMVYGKAEDSELLTWLKRHTTLTDTQVNLWADGLVRGLVAPSTALARVQ